MPPNAEVNLSSLQEIIKLTGQTKHFADRILAACHRIADTESDEHREDRMADDIAESAKFLQHFMNAGPVFAVELFEGIYDPIIIKSTRILEQMFGYAPGQLDGQPISTIIPPDKREQHLRWLRGFLDNPQDRQMGNLGNVEPEGFSRDGRRFPIVLMWSVYFLDKRCFLAGTVMQQVVHEKSSGTKPA